MRSNEGIAEEVARITDYARPLEDRFACSTEVCTNQGLSIAVHPDRYSKAGYYKTPANQHWQCKVGRRRMLVSAKSSKIHAKNRTLAVDVLSRIANKSPMRLTVNGGGSRQLQRLLQDCRFHPSPLQRP